MTASTQHPDFPDSALIVLIGASGAGKSTLARSWPATQVLSLDTLRGVVSDDPGDQSATRDAADALKLILDRRMKRGLTTVIDATNVEQSVRVDLVIAAKRHGRPAVAVLVTVPLSQCIARQDQRPDNRRVPPDTVRTQHEAMVYSRLTLETEGFSHIRFAHTLPRLGPYLRRLSEARDAALDVDDDLLPVSQVFGPDLLPLWHWTDTADAAGRGRTAEIRLGHQHLTLRAHGEGEDTRFEVLVPCPQCEEPAWAPACSVTDLYLALAGITDIDCIAHGTPHRTALI